MCEVNREEDEGRLGVSIGCQDPDDLPRRNHVVRNGSKGVFIRDEVAGTLPYYNRLEADVSEADGRDAGVVVDDRCRKSWEEASSKR